VSNLRGFLLVPLARGGYSFGDWGVGAFSSPRRSGKCSAGVSGDFIGGFALVGNRWVATQRINEGAV